ncbi:MAG: ATP-binding cassette domain-containing protein [Planctomycetes bacterium]|nr:ATP-binding cassette domain-containing protein [Planctomycetota bacterium]
MNESLQAQLWPASQLAAAQASAARHSRLAAAVPEPIDAHYAELGARLFDSAPALVRIDTTLDAGYALVVGRRGRCLLLLGPDLRVHPIDVDVVRSGLCAAIEAPLLPAIDRLLVAADLPPSRRGAARTALLRQQLAARPVSGILRLRPPPSERLPQALWRAGALRHLATFLLAHATHYALWILSWWMVGGTTLAGRFDPGWFAGWALVLATLVPFRLLATWSQGAFAMAAGGVLKRRLLDAGLCLDPQAVRGAGVGSFVGRTIEAEAIESLALGGGTVAVTAAIELLVAGLLLALAAHSASLSWLLLAWTALVVGGGVWCLRRRRHWTQARLDLTYDLVEKMIGHRTRLAQARPATWHQGEDEALERYLGSSRRLDAANTWLLAVAPRGWLLLALLVLGLALVGGVPSPTELAVGLGGVLLAHQALSRLVFGLADLGGAAIAWRQIVPMLDALSHVRPPAPTVSGITEPATPADSNGRPGHLLGAHQLAFTHPSRNKPVIDGLDLAVFAGDRILLEGASGSGKSTLASLLGGQRSPDAGVVLFGGIDRQTLGDEAWRRRIAMAPQFHENHVLSESLAFNLLMGRRWPPHAEDVQQAEELCRELGLADLLARMPAGLFEMVGESGWQLSHGERSRLFLARALLQQGEIVMLDESFTALDPSTQAASLRCALAHSKTLIVIAHP